MAFRVSYYGRDVWAQHVDLAKYGLDFSGEPSQEAVNAEADSLKQRLSTKDAIVAIALPKGLSNGNLRQIAWEKKVWIADEVKSESKIESTYVVLTTDQVLFGTRGSAHRDVQLTLKERGCETPTVIEALSLVFLRFVNEGFISLPRDPRTYTYCAEKLYEKPLMVGSFSPSVGQVHAPYGVRLGGEDFSCISVERNHWEIEAYGVLGVRRIK